MDEVLDIAGENVWSISIVAAPPQPVVVSNDLHNVPDNALYGVIYSTPGNAGMETWFFGHPHDSPAPSPTPKTPSFIPRIAPAQRDSCQSRLEPQSVGSSLSA